MNRFAIIAAAALAAGSIGYVGCDRDETTSNTPRTNDTAGDKVDRAVDKAGDVAGNVTDKTVDATKDAGAAISDTCASKISLRATGAGCAWAPRPGAAAGLEGEALVPRPQRVA